MTRTPWYPGNVTPVRVGWYERIVNDTWVRKSWWNGSLWLLAPYTESNHYQYLPWRGLTEPHGESK